MVRPLLGAALLSAAFLLALLPACREQTAAGQDPMLAGLRRREAPRVLVEPARVQEMVHKIETTTRVESEQQVVVYARGAGVVVEIAVEEGQRVQAGQVLARLDDRVARIALADAESSLELAEANQPKLEVAVLESEARAASALLAYEQAERDHQRNESIAQGEAGQPGLISRKDLDASRLVRDQRKSDHLTASLAHDRVRLEEQAGHGAIERARLARERAALDLTFLSIEAPFAGVIAQRSIQVGDTVGPTTPAFTLTDPERLRAVFYRPQRELLLFRPGAATAGEGLNGGAGGSALPDLEIFATADALPDLRFRGAIERVAPTIDPASGNFRVTARMDMWPQEEHRSGRSLLPGMLVRLEIVTERRAAALVVPKRALRREGDRTLLFLVQDGRACAVEVREGFRSEQDVEVLSSDARLVAGAQVVVVGNRDLEEGLEVQVGEAEAGALAEEPEIEGAAAVDSTPGAG